MQKAVILPNADRSELTPARLSLVLKRLIEYEFKPWNFGHSIGFEGMLAGSDLLEQPEWLGYEQGFFRAWAASSRARAVTDHTVPGRVMVDVIERTDDSFILTAIQQLAAELRERPRVGGVLCSFPSVPMMRPYGGTAVPPEERSLLEDAGPGAHVDLLHFDPPLFAALGRLTGDAELVEAAADEATRYCRLLQNEESGLFFHFFLERTGRRYIHGWSRGQGWALLGLLDVISCLDTTHHLRGPLVAHVEALVAALRRSQHRDGHWPAMIGGRGGGMDSSASAFFAAGLYRGASLGVLNRRDLLDCAERAWQASISATDDTGVVQGVSHAVGTCTVPDHYRHVPVGGVWPWGQGPVLVASLERARWLSGVTKPST